VVQQVIEERGPPARIQLVLDGREVVMVLPADPSGVRVILNDEVGAAYAD
jgi:hypothetical protein